MSDIFFYLFALFSLVFSCCVVVSKQPVYSIFSLVMVFVSVSALFILVGAEFLGMLLIVVYVGAIAVLFLFTVMMMDLSNLKSQAKNFFSSLMKISFVFLMFLSVSFIYSESEINNSSKVEKFSLNYPVSGETDVEAFASVLYDNLMFPFQVLGLVLLVAMVGAISLTLDKGNKSTLSQNVFKQLGDHGKEKSVQLLKVDFYKGVD